jgi:hypothetical protein
MNMEHWWNGAERDKTKAVGENRVPVLQHPPQIPHGLY